MTAEFIQACAPAILAPFCIIVGHLLVWRAGRPRRRRPPPDPPAKGEAP